MLKTDVQASVAAAVIPCLQAPLTVPTRIETADFWHFWDVANATAKIP